MTPHRLVMGRKPRILHEPAQRTFGAQPIARGVARNGSDLFPALKNVRDIRLTAMRPRPCHTAYVYLIEVIAEKAALIYRRLKDCKSSPGGMEDLFVKFPPTFLALREIVR